MSEGDRGLRMSSEKLRWVWGAISKMRRGCRIRDFIHAAWLTHGDYVIDSWPARREATADRNPPIDHDLYHEFIEEFKGQGPRRWCHPQPPASARIEKTRIGCRIWSNNVSLGGHLEINLSQQLRLGKGPSLWGTVPYGLRARERRWHCEIICLTQHLLDIIMALESLEKDQVGRSNSRQRLEVGNHPCF